MNDVALELLPEELREIFFTTVISTEVFEHLYDPRAYVQFVKRILDGSGGGLFIVSTPYYGYLKNVVLVLLNRMDCHYSALWREGASSFGHGHADRAVGRGRFRTVTFQGSGPSALVVEPYDSGRENMTDSRINSGEKVNFAENFKRLWR